MSDQTTTSNNRPDYLAYHVQGQGQKANWVKLGAAWYSRDGEGLSLQLDTLPLPLNSFDGRIVLRKPKD